MNIPSTLQNTKIRPFLRVPRRPQKWPVFGPPRTGLKNDNFMILIASNIININSMTSTTSINEHITLQQHKNRQKWAFFEGSQNPQKMAIFGPPRRGLKNRHFSHFWTLQPSFNHHQLIINIIENRRNTKFLSFFSFLNFEKLFFKSCTKLW